MSGILGIIVGPSAVISGFKTRGLTRDLIRAFELRREVETGLVLMNDRKIIVVKQSATRSSKLISSSECLTAFNSLVLPDEEGVPTGDAIIGQVQIASKETVPRETQLLSSKGIVGVLQGRLLNVEETLKKFPRVGPFCSEARIFPALVRLFLDCEDTLEQAVQHAFAELSGTATVALLLRDRNQVAFATNNGSLYVASPKNYPALVFASEKRVLENTLSKFRHRGTFGGSHISQIPAGFGCTIDVTTLEFHSFSLRCDAEYVDRSLPRRFNRDIIDMNDYAKPE